MTQDIKQRVAEYKAKVQFAIDNHGKGKYYFDGIFWDELHAEGLKAQEDYIKDLAAQNEKLIETLKYINNRIFDLETGNADLRGNKYLTDSRHKIKATLKSLGINPTNGDV